MSSKNDLKALLKEKDPFNDILGQEKVKEQVKSALTVERHVLIVGPPGIGKTTLAKNIAKILPEIEVNDCSYNCSKNNPICPECKTKKSKTKRVKGEDRFVRIQGSPDLTVEDLLGDIDPTRALKFGPLSMEAFTPGKIFKANNGVLFFDDLNRCPEKLQNALLQVLQEKKATIGSYDVDLDANFIFIATMNPDDTSTERLSDVLLDRFDVVYMEYPETIATEMEIARKHGKNLTEFPEELLKLAVMFVREMRGSDSLLKVPGVRATIGLYERAQSNAFLDDRQQVSFNDIKQAVESVISHRIELKPSVKYLQEPKTFVKQMLEDFIKRHKPSISLEDTSEKGGPG